MDFLRKQTEFQIRRRKGEPRRVAPIVQRATAFADVKALSALVFVTIFMAATSLAIAVSPAQAKHHHATRAAHQKAPGKSTMAKSNPAEAGPDRQANPEVPASEPPPPPYEPQILRLAEILGALAYLDDLCGSTGSADWRAKMQQLLEAEAKTTFRKERLAGTFNRSFRDYERSYRACTPNAQAIITRFLAEGGKLAHEVVNRYSAS